MTADVAQHVNIETAQIQWSRAGGEGVAHHVAIEEAWIHGWKRSGVRGEGRDGSRRRGWGTLGLCVSGALVEEGGGLGPVGFQISGGGDDEAVPSLYMYFNL